jgi:glycosyltransferase involved in cell wall biosynthesis
LASVDAEEKKGCDNTNLRKAAKTKNDEFYTRYEDIEAEVMKYRRQFRDKIVYLPCDDPAEKKSEFWSFFVNNFDAFGLKKLIATHYDENGKAYKIWIDGDHCANGFIDDDDALHEDLQGKGDFRSDECIEILKECDIVCTNPPFSLFREFIDLILAHNKQFLVIGSQNAFTYKEIFKLIKDNKVVKLYRMPGNSGQAAVRKFAIQQATGDYIIHCYSDDWIEIDMYKRMYEVASETTSDIVICDFYQSTDSEDKYIKACFNHEMPYLIYELMQ